MTIAATVWQPQGNTEGDYDSITADTLVDPTSSSIIIIDPADSTIDVISTTNSFTSLPSTVWVGDDSA